MNAEEEALRKAGKAKEASKALTTLPTEVKNLALRAMAESLEKNAERIIAENSMDVDAATKSGLTRAFIDRLTLNRHRIVGMASELREIVALPDPVGEVIDGWTTRHGLEIRRVRVPLGVVALIYESRPNVTSDAAGICLKSGNAVLLRGGSEAIRSNIAIARLLSKTAMSQGVPEGAIQIIETTDRKAVTQMLRLREFIDVVIPRGGADLIRTVVENSTVPVIETGTGICHTYVDDEADLEAAERIVFNAKTQRPSTCNSLNTLLVHRSVANRFLPSAVSRLEEARVEIRGCKETRKIAPTVKPATDDDWKTEYLDLILAVRVVSGVREAIDHINTYGTHHSDAIITQNYDRAHQFTREVDSATVYVNASTRFTDGNQFGMGSEIGISTQKLHARGPMSVRELTSSKFVVLGSGQVRE